MITILVIIILTHVFILSKLIFFPYPELFIYPYLTNHGLIPYINIFDQHFPGLVFFPINLGTLGMNTPEVARLWQYGVVILTQIILYLVARKFFGPKKAILANIFFILWQPFFEGWVLWIDSFLPILTLSSLYFLIHKQSLASQGPGKQSLASQGPGKQSLASQGPGKQNLPLRGKNYFWSGLLLGLALLFKQVLIPLIALVAIYILFKEKKFKALLTFGLGVLIPVSFLVLYITKLGIWKDFIFWTITFNMTTFAQMGRKYAVLSQIVRALGVYGFSLFAFFSKKLKEETLLIGLFLVGSLASIYARFDFVHLQPSLPFVALLSVYSIGWLAERKYLRILIAVYVLASIILLLQFYKGHVGDKVFFFGDSEKRVVTEIQKLSNPDDKIFTLGTLPHIYQMAKRLPPGQVFVFQFPWFMIEAENKVLTGIINDPPRVVIRDPGAMVEGVNLISFMPRINDYINRNYKVVNKIDGIEIMVKK